MNGWEFYSGSDLRDFVITHVNKNEILKDVKFKEYLLRPENHYAFVWLVQDLSFDDAQVLLDNLFLEKIIETDERAEDKFNAIIDSKSEIFLSANDKILEYILDSKDLYFLFSDFDVELADKLFNFVINKSPNKLFILEHFEDSVQEKLLTVDNIEKLNKFPDFKCMILNLKPKAIIKLLSFENYRKMIENFTDREMVKFTSVLINDDLTEIFLNNNSFILNVATQENPNYYRNIINNLSYNNYEIVMKIEKYRLKFVKKQFELVDEDGVFEYYNEIKNYIENNGFDSKIYDRIPDEIFLCDDFSIEQFVKLTKRRKIEMLCDSYFKDYAQNVLYNLKIITEYNKNKNIIDSNRLNIYNKFLNFDNISSNEIKNLLEIIEDDDYSNLLYEDIRKCRDISYRSYNDEFLKLNSSLDIYDEKLTEKYNVEVYKLEGEPFLLCVHKGFFARGKCKNETISLSLIGTENIGVYDNNIGIILGFDYLESSRIMHVSPADSFSQKKRSSKHVNRIYDAHDLLQQTYFYNEILYNENHNGNLVPSCVVCNDYIDESSLDYAKKNSLPIIIINTKKYNINKKESEKQYYQDSYILESGDYFAK